MKRDYAADLYFFPGVTALICLSHISLNYPERMGHQEQDFLRPKFFHAVFSSRASQRRLCQSHYFSTFATYPLCFIFSFQQLLWHSIQLRFPDIVGLYPSVLSHCCVWSTRLCATLRNCPLSLIFPLQNHLVHELS